MVRRHPSVRAPASVVTRRVSSIAIAALLAPALSAGIVHVDRTVPAGGDGSTWALAYKNLAVALGDAGPGDEVRVAQGTYLPDQGSGDPASTFAIPRGVKLLGGYAGHAAPDPDANDPVAYPTVLSGDLLGNDGDHYTNRADNCVHVVTTLDGPFVAGIAWTLDGFTIRGGDADGVPSSVDSHGGGVLSAGGVLALHIARCTIEDNEARQRGGGVSSDANLTLVDSVVRDNRVGPDNSAQGGGLWAGQLLAHDSTIEGNTIESSALPGRGGGAYVVRLDEMSGCRVVGNVNLAQLGGGLYAQSTGVLRDTLFMDNFVESNGNGARGGGADLTKGLFAQTQVSGCRFLANSASGPFARSGALSMNGSAVVADSIFVGNEAIGSGAFGGAVAHTFGTTLHLCSSTFTANHADGGAGGLQTEGATTLSRVANTIFWANTGPGSKEDDQVLVATGNLTVTHCTWDGLQSLTDGNIRLNPLFIDADGADDVLGTEDDDLRLSNGSPAVDSGSVAELPADAVDLDCDLDVGEPLPIDLDGKARRHDDPGVADTGTGAAPLPDMGAYEHRAGLPTERWTNLGGALGSAFGTPSLTGSGVLCPGTPMELFLAGARPDTTATLVIGLTVLSAPFKGGTLVPDADVLIGGLPIGPGGGFLIGLDWPEQDLSGLALAWQVWVVDDTAVKGLSASNGVLGIAP